MINQTNLATLITAISEAEDFSIARYWYLKEATNCRSPSCIAGWATQLLRGSIPKNHTGLCYTKDLSTYLNISLDEAIDISLGLEWVGCFPQKTEVIDLLAYMKNTGEATTWKRWKNITS